MCTPMPRDPAKWPQYEFFLPFCTVDCNITLSQSPSVIVFLMSCKFGMEGDWILKEHGGLLGTGFPPRSPAHFVRASFSPGCGSVLKRSIYIYIYIYISPVWSTLLNDQEHFKMALFFGVEKDCGAAIIPF